MEKKQLMFSLQFFGSSTGQPAIQEEFWTIVVL